MENHIISLDRLLFWYFPITFIISIYSWQHVIVFIYVHPTHTNGCQSVILMPTETEIVPFQNFFSRGITCHISTSSCIKLNSYETNYDILLYSIQQYTVNFKILTRFYKCEFKTTIKTVKSNYCRRCKKKRSYVCNIGKI